MPSYERTQVIEHEIGAEGTLGLRTLSGPIRVRGVEGGIASVRATYHVIAADDVEATRAVDASALQVDRSPGHLEVAIREDRQGALDAIARFLRGERTTVDLDVQVPAGATLRVDTVSGDIRAEGTHGAQHYRTVSGRVGLDGVGGALTLEGISGEQDVRASGPARLTASAVSGAVRVQAPELEALHASTLSGNVRLAAGLAAAGQHRLETVSGDVRLEPACGVTVRVHGLSGGISCEPTHRLEGAAGDRTLIVGDGRASLTFSTMSGDLVVVSPGAQAAGSAASTGTSSDADLAVLRALEAGDIDVDEAARRLAAAREAAHA